MNLKHLETFLGKPDQMLDLYIIRFIENNTVQFITTTGYVMCVNTFHDIKHTLTGQVFGVSPAEFQKILMFEDLITGFTPIQTGLVLQSGVVELPVDTLDQTRLPNLDKIFMLEPVNDSDTLSFTPANFKLIVKYCKLMKSDEFNVALTGDKLPMIISDRNWSIFIMPLET